MGTPCTVERTFTIVNKLGLHARPATLFVKTAIKFSSRITVQTDGLAIDGKSIIGLLTLAATKGTSLTVCAHGDDAGEAIDALEKLVARKFGES